MTGTSPWQAHLVSFEILDPLFMYPNKFHHQQIYFRHFMEGRGYIRVFQKNTFYLKLNIRNSTGQKKSYCIPIDSDFNADLKNEPAVDHLLNWSHEGIGLKYMSVL